MRKTKATLFAILIGLPGMSMAQDSLSDGTPIRPDDLHRLQALDNSAGMALREAFASGDDIDLDRLIDALSGRPVPAEEAMELIPGKWSCQMIKLGNILPIVVYPNFTCVVTEAGGFAKTSGSQRTKGRLHQDQDRLIYLGTGYIDGDTPPAYADLPEEVSAQDDPQRMPEVGVVEMIDGNKGRILFPSPYLESRMNLLLLTR